MKKHEIAKRDFFKMNLQRHSEGNTADTGTDPVDKLEGAVEGEEGTDPNTLDKPEGKMFTQEELDEIIKDRLARDRVKTKESILKELEEAKKIDKLPENERAAALLEQEKAKFEAEKAELEEERAAFKLNQVMVEKELPFADLVPLLSKVEEDEAMKVISDLEVRFNQAVQLKVLEKLKSNGWSSGQGQAGAKGESIGERLAKQAISNKAMTKEHDYF